MLSFDEALAKILGECKFDSENFHSVPLESALFKILATPVKAKFDLPRFNNSAVDGYGVIVEDLLSATEDKPVSLKLVGEVAAGTNLDTDNLSIAPGSCLKIFTGAPVPDSVEAVVMREFCREESSAQDTSVHISTKVRIGENIRLVGEELEAGQTVLTPGTVLTPPNIGLAANLGEAYLNCVRAPRVAIVSTGDELIEPGNPLGEGQIYDSNSFALQAAVEALHIDREAIKRYHTGDDPSETERVLTQALSDCDVFISAGGVSVGDKDFVKTTLEKLGVETVFWKIAIKPGKPVYFGVLRGKKNKLIFGLPGNPVSALVTFHLLVRPALLKMQGVNPGNKSQKAQLARSLKKKAGRLDFVRATTADTEGRLTAMPTTGQESHMLTGLAKADSLIVFAPDLEFASEGDLLPILPLDW